MIKTFCDSDYQETICDECGKVIHTEGTKSKNPRWTGQFLMVANWCAECCPFDENTIFVHDPDNLIVVLDKRIADRVKFD